MREISRKAAHSFAIDQEYHEEDTTVSTVYGVGGLVLETRLYLRGQMIAYKTAQGTWIQPKGRIDQKLVDRLNALLSVKEGYVFLRDESIYYADPRQSVAIDIKNIIVEVA